MASPTPHNLQYVTEAPDGSGATVSGPVNISDVNFDPNNTSMVEEYILGILGPQHVSYSALLPLTAVYMVIAVGGVVGNALTCLVVARNHTMRTSTNYYLVNLAVADLLTLCLTLPVEVYQMWVQYPWPLGEAACRLRAMVPETLTHVSVLTILAVSGERYVAITDPVYARTTHTLTRTARVLPVIWLTSMLAAVPLGYFQKVNLVKSPLGSDLPQSAWCAIPYDDPSPRYCWLLWASSVGAFMLPMAVLIVLYCKIGMVLSIDPPTRTPAAGAGAMHTRKVGIRMLVAVVVAFFLCWAPFHAQRLMFVTITTYGQWTPYHRSVNTKLFYCTGICYYLNSAVNPILYSVMSVRFRIAFRRSLCGGKAWARKQLYLSNTHGHLHLSNNSNILNRTREISTTTSTRRVLDTNYRNGINYVFVQMEIQA
ncbi:neuromedin-U receptor 2 [Procambarus clarkii]|uniref:neuromedin-U receptor 2 n=1 Tax=Procambarus clarkii TaxID=6728 RepID=UPI001E678E1A|nr:neuromedin-U receptor 2-like [Procambarus clarkii]